jgi:hypothetical protein
MIRPYLHLHHGLLRRWRFMNIGWSCVGSIFAANVGRAVAVGGTQIRMHLVKRLQKRNREVHGDLPL